VLFCLTRSFNDMANPSEFIFCETSTELEAGLEGLIRSTAAEAIADRGTFLLGVSGASMVKQLSNVIPKIYPAGKEEWEKWHVSFCDERVVPFDDEQSTFGLYKRTWLVNVPALEAQFVTIDQHRDAEWNARHYHNQLVKHCGNAIWPKFDLLLLGMGPDGHTCSLFPGHPLLNEKKAWVAAITDSPKPPPARITLTLPVVNHARTVAFVVGGEGKAEVVRNILEENNSGNYPAGLVQPQLNGGKLVWILDGGASSKLKQKDVKK